jgi:hypothetical protein
MTQSRPPENRLTHVIPAKTGIHSGATAWTPACAGVTTLILISSGGLQAHEYPLAGFSQRSFVFIDILGSFVRF